jgi:hypothetical protein
MPTFCRHNHLIQNCPICAREQAIEPRPVVSSSAPRASQPRERTAAERTSSSRRRPGSSGAQSGGVRVRRLARGADDGYRSPLAPGLKSSDDAERLAREVAVSTRRLLTLESEPPGLYADVADSAGDREELTWLAFLIAYLAPLTDDDPFAAIRAARVPWSEADELSLDDVATGPRAAHDAMRGLQTVEAYGVWAQRAGSQAAAFTGEASWTPERRFDRVFERMALPGMHRDARFDLLVTLGRLGVYELRAGRLQLGGANAVTVAAKRVLGIGDSILLERRAADLAGACGAPLEALDLALYNWSEADPGDDSGRATGGLGASVEPDEDALDAARGALAL